MNRIVSEAYRFSPNYKYNCSKIYTEIDYADIVHRILVKFANAKVFFKLRKNMNACNPFYYAI